MRTEKEIKEEIESLKKSRDSFVVETVEWKSFNFGIKELEWVIEDMSRRELAAEELADKLLDIAMKCDIRFTCSDEEMKKELVRVLLIDRGKE